MDKQEILHKASVVRLVIGPKTTECEMLEEKLKLESKAMNARKELQVKNNISWSEMMVTIASWTRSHMTLATKASKWTTIDKLMI